MENGPIFSPQLRVFILHWCNYTNILWNQSINEVPFRVCVIISNDNNNLLSDFEKDFKSKTLKAMDSVSLNLIYFTNHPGSLTNHLIRKSKSWVTNCCSKHIEKVPKLPLPCFTHSMSRQNPLQIKHGPGLHVL